MQTMELAESRIYTSAINIKLTAIIFIDIFSKKMILSWRPSTTRRLPIPPPFPV